MLNPQRTLERGYVILQQADGQVIRSAQQIQAGDFLSLRTAADSSELEIAAINTKKKPAAKKTKSNE
jgi:exodeoxyribonuclease VII large subunit